MLYGRLDIFSPDGPIQTFPLEDPNISIGRSSGNTIALENSTISRYHISITREQNQVFITDMDSANGTFVDGTKLTDNQPRPLQDGEEILIGNLRIIFHRIDNASTVKLEPLDETTQRVELALANFYIDLHGPPHAIAPGASVSAELAITNTTDEDMRFRVEVSGVTKEWVRIDRPTPMAAANDSAFVLINFKPLRQPQSTPGNYEVKVRVYPSEKPDDILESTLLLTILPYGGFGIDLEKKDIATGERFHLLLHNQGSDNLPLVLSGKDRAGALDFRFAAPRVTLAPGQQRVAEGEVRPRHRLLIGKTRTYEFDLIAQSQNRARFMVIMRGTLTARPLIPGWFSVLVLGIVAVVGVVIAFALSTALNRPAPVPYFAGFEVNKAEVARGEVLEINWQATDVADIRLSVNGTPVVEETDTQTAQYSLRTDDLSGAVTILLEGMNGDQRDSRSATIQVYEPMRVERFVVDPPQLVRYVVQALNIEWNVPGASTTRVVGLESFTTVSVESGGPAGSFRDIPGIPTDPMLLTLLGRDDFGNTLEHSLAINVIDPECAPAAGTTTIFDGPGRAYQVIGMVPADVTVTVDARDSSGDWVRVIGLSGGLSGWVAVNELTCATTFTVRDLQIEPNIAPPPPTATATPTATPSPTLTMTPTIAPTRTAQHDADSRADTIRLILQVAAMLDGIVAKALADVNPVSIATEGWFSRLIVFLQLPTASVGGSHCPPQSR